MSPNYLYDLLYSLVHHRLGAARRSIADVAALLNRHLIEEYRFQSGFANNELAVALECLRLGNDGEVDAARCAKRVDRCPVLVESTAVSMVLRQIEHKLQKRWSIATLCV